MIQFKFKNASHVIALLLTPILLMGSGCADDFTVNNPLSIEKNTAAIQRVLKLDEQIGAARNHASEKISLLDAIEKYLSDIDSIDWTDCPADFVAAFKAHRDAWHDSKQLFSKFPDLRGEMHDLFDQIREMPEHKPALLAVEEAIWGTWRAVEAAQDEFGKASN